MKKVGIYAGTFDPVHDGHIAFALQSARQARLEKVLFLPEQRPRIKLRVTAFADRVAMLKLAVEKHDLLEVIELKEEQFSVGGTLPGLQRRFGRNLSLLMGSDVAKYLDGWREVEKLIEQTELIIALRQGDPRIKVEKMMTSIGAPRFLCLASPNPQAASSNVRPGNFKKNIDPSVQAYIVSKGLYPLALGTN